MKRELHKLKIIIAGFVLVFLYSCHSVDEYANDPYGNFDALWSILDERYCFFEYKDIDWNQIREKYRSRIGRTCKSFYTVQYFPLLEMV